MKKILFITVYPSPYRVGFFNLLGAKTDLTVYFVRRPDEIAHRDAGWFDTDYSGFRAVFPEKTLRLPRGRVLAGDITGVISGGFDRIVVGGWSEPTFMRAISYMKRRGIPFSMEIDGGFASDDGAIRRCVKRHFISAASEWYSTGRVPTEYLVHYGADPGKIFLYPFTSQSAADIPDFGPDPAAERKRLRAEAKSRLGFGDRRLVLAVGQFIPRKGFDVLIRAAAGTPELDYVIVGGEPTDEYTSLRDAAGAANVSFAGFMRRDELRDYYLAADVFAMPTREDIWGLVVNEALSFGLPVVSTDRCVAALELVKNGSNGFIVPAGDDAELAAALSRAVRGDADGFFAEARNSVRGYTLEDMAERHLELFGEA